MLQVNQLIGFGAAPRSSGVTVSHLGSLTDTGFDAQSNFSFGSFGAEAADRDLIALITARDATTYNATSVTIGGVSATIEVDTGGVGTQCICVIARARVPTGASGDVVVDWSEDIADDQRCTLLRATGLSAAAPATASFSTGTSGTNTTADVNTVTGGLVVACMANGNDPNLNSWSLDTEVDDIMLPDTAHMSSSAYEIIAVGSTPLTVTCTFDASGSTNRCMAVASYSPA